MKSSSYDILVVGAGHAGVEACLATSRLGLKTLLLTSSLDHISFMSCNPSIGGLAKGHMVRELDVLGGQMALAADQSCIQFKRLNSSRGPAVRGTRVQSDKHEYSRYMSEILRSQENLELLAADVAEVLIEREVAKGVRLRDGSEIFARKVILTTGTFMNGILHLGLNKTSGGRVGEKASVGLSDQLRSLGFEVRRLKTGTPARLLKESIDWSQTIPQAGDERYIPFSFRSPSQLRLPQILCHLSHTTEETHEIIRRNMHLSPMYSGQIEGTGPRYCPSIEDKISRFADKLSHQTFLEPEGLNTDLIYLQGISTSLPAEVQLEFLKTIPGLQNVQVARFGYAVEYDYFEPFQINHQLETRAVRGLYFAGQINGTSGYEEAAVQGFLAGVNAARSTLEMPEFVLGRDEAYIGVLVDDLITKGTKEPYRMFTSRAEHRLVLREDNVLDRLAKSSAEIGLLGDEAKSLMNLSLERRALLRRELESRRITPKEETQKWLIQKGSSPLLKSASLEEILRRPELSFRDLGDWLDLGETPELDQESVEIEIKYKGYVKRQMELIEAARRMDSLSLPETLAFSEIYGLSQEEKEKLTKVRPKTLGQAARISGVNPSAIQSILVYLKGHRKKISSLEMPPE